MTPGREKWERDMATFKVWAARYIGDRPMDRALWIGAEGAWLARADLAATREAELVALLREARESVERDAPEHDTSLTDEARASLLALIDAALHASGEQEPR